MKGKKTGGRTSGTLNKKSQAVGALIAQRYPTYHPILSLVEIAQDTSNEVSLRLQANKEVAKYVCPQLKSIEIKEPQEETKIIVVVRDEETKRNIEMLGE